MRKNQVTGPTIEIFAVILGVLVVMLIVGMFMCGCGAAPPPVPPSPPAPTAGVYTWATAVADCGGCHGKGGSVPLAFMDSEAAFKANPRVGETVAGGTMPKGRTFSANEKTAFLEYYNRKS